MANFNTLAEVQTSTSGDFYHLQQGGIDYKHTRETLAGAISNARWSSTFAYNVGSEVVGSDNEKYVAVASSTGEDPSTDDGTYWRFVSRDFPLSYSNLYHIQDQKSSGTAGGGALAATYNTRDLNTELVANISGASLSSNQITLPLGTYLITASSQTHQVDRHRLYLYNATDATYDIIGENAYTGTTTEATSFSRLEGVINLASSKVFELRHYTTTAKTNNGLGVDVSNGDTEVYTDVKIWRVA